MTFNKKQHIRIALQWQLWFELNRAVNAIFTLNSENNFFQWTKPVEVIIFSMEIKISIFEVIFFYLK